MAHGGRELEWWTAEGRVQQNESKLVLEYYRPHANLNWLKTDEITWLDRAEQAVGLWGVLAIDKVQRALTWDWDSERVWKCKRRQWLLKIWESVVIEIEKIVEILCFPEREQRGCDCWRGDKDNYGLQWRQWLGVRRGWDAMVVPCFGRFMLGCGVFCRDLFGTVWGIWMWWYSCFGCRRGGMGSVSHKRHRVSLFPRSDSPLAG